jgi:purine nucleosidase
MAHTQRIIFDTDIGTDVDDCLALALILSSPKLQLEGVTCVHGDVDLRAHGDQVASAAQPPGVTGHGGSQRTPAGPSSRILARARRAWPAR